MIIAKDMLANKHAHSRDMRIQFYEPTHKYTVDGNTDYVSVTTWVHTHFAKFDADATISKMMQSSQWGESKYFGKTRQEIKNIWNANGKKAASAGTNLHRDIERYYNGLPVSNDTKEYRQFIEFSKTYKFEPYRTEWIIFDEELKLAGSIDMVYILPDGTLMIYDWKRSKGIIQHTQYAKYASTECIQHIPDTNYWHYVLQLNTYKSILERKYDKKVSRLCLVCLYPDQDNFILYDVPFIEKEMECLFKIRKTKLIDF